MNLMVNPTITGFRQEVDGTIKELKLGEAKEDAYANIIEQGGSAKLDNNKTATIDVSTYTEPVVINPTSGKDGMKKATVTLSNIPSPSPATSVTFYAWAETGQGSTPVFTLSETPSVDDYCYFSADDNIYAVETTDPATIIAIGEGTITYSMPTTGGEGGGATTEVTLSRQSTMDLEFPKASS